ncbi:hypothetical protein ON010_g18002 [Phytophthora cinnamomi]|nr:hypothetical protein ON010_g18002 [Phytophthora cinnamomi]
MRARKKAKKAKQKAAAGSTEKVGLLPPAELRGGVDSVDVPVPPPSIGGLSSTWAAATGSGTGGGEQDVHVTATQATSRQPGSAPSNDQQKPPPSFIPTETNWFASAAQHPPAYGDSQTFQRILKWKFNDLKMILGSQVLLFSNQEHPAVSLKLHDMDKELSLCTVLDYYLDNVIANIPELAICLHSKGLVRGYKLVETRQIPYMSGSGRPLFDVQDVSMNASMLLKFLQENCSRPNGTYWLHRKEAQVEVYDGDVMLSVCCSGVKTGEFARSGNAAPAATASATSARAIASICSSVSEQLADTYLRECRTTDSTSDDSDRGSAIESLEKAKQYLRASIRLFEECMPKDSGAVLTHSDDGINDIEAIEGDGELAPGDEDDEGEMGSFMNEELNRLQLKFSSACLELGQLYAGTQKWADAVRCIVEASKFLPLRLAA